MKEYIPIFDYGKLIICFIEPDKTKSFYLRHGLQKLTSQHRHFQTTIAFVHSPRAQPVLKCKLTIKTLTLQLKHEINLTLEATDGRHIIDHIARDFYNHGRSWPEVLPAKLYTKYFNPLSPSQPHQQGPGVPCVHVPITVHRNGLCRISYV